MEAAGLSIVDRICGIDIPPETTISADQQWYIYVKFRSFLLIDFVNSKEVCDLTYAFPDREIWPDNVVTVDK